MRSLLILIFLLASECIEAQSAKELVNDKFDISFISLEKTKEKQKFKELKTIIKGTSIDFKLDTVRLSPSERVEKGVIFGILEFNVLNKTSEILQFDINVMDLKASEVKQDLVLFVNDWYSDLYKSVSVNPNQAINLRLLFVSSVEFEEVVLSYADSNSVSLKFSESPDYTP